MATPNMPAGEWPDLSAEELREVGELLRDAEHMRAHENDGPLLPPEKK